MLEEIRGDFFIHSVIVMMTVADMLIHITVEGMYVPYSTVQRTGGVKKNIISTEEVFAAFYFGNVEAALEISLACDGYITLAECSTYKYLFGNRRKCKWNPNPLLDGVSVVAFGFRCRFGC